MCAVCVDVLPTLSGIPKPVIAACKGLNTDTLEHMDEVMHGRAA